MAQAMASMAGLRGSSQVPLEGSFQMGGSTRLNNSTVALTRPGFTLRVQAQAQAQAQQQMPAEPETSRRAVLSLVAAGLGSGSFVQAVLAAAKSIPVGPPPPPSGGLPGTLNSDEARDFDLPLKERFFIQALTPVGAAKRAKESAQDIVKVKEFIDKRAWPYVMNDLRNKAGYLRYDLNTVINSKTKEEKQSLKDLTGKLFQDIDDLDYAAKIKSSTKAEKYYAKTVSTLNAVLAKLG
ncbi:oxygen-evolving enhancer protein 3-2, chloroplastic-like [Tripterygium wilfordii]|nr:oxygen-evolving enhancer protein 3-2, chloroplastic-like [Tripterygium wilfordii]